MNRNARTTQVSQSAPVMEQKTPDGVRIETARVLNSGGKIEAIKFVREKTGLGLAQAKAYVEAIQSGRNPDEAARSMPPGNSALVQIVFWIVLVGVGGFIWWFARLVEE